MGADESAVTVSGPDGRALAAVWSRPEGDGPHPAVVLCQGFSGVKHIVLPDIAEHLASSGVASIRFDYRGFGDSEGEPGWMDPDARCDDALAVLAWVSGHEQVDGRRLGIYGHSYGGPIAVATASRDRRVRAAVSVSGPGCGTRWLRSLHTSWEWIDLIGRLEDERTRLARTGESTMVDQDVILPLSPAFRKRYAELTGQGTTTQVSEHAKRPRFHLSSLDRMRNFHPEDDARRLSGCALLVLHGEDDDTAPVEFAEEIRRNAPGPTQLVAFAGKSHIDLDTGPGFDRVCHLAAEWFTDHL